jgi:hypothetical protein
LVGGVLLPKSLKVGKQINEFAKDSFRGYNISQRVAFARKPYDTAKNRNIAERAGC